MTGTMTKFMPRNTIQRKRTTASSYLGLLAACLFLVGCCCCSPFATAKEIEATNEWTLLGENDTVAAGMHVRMDLTTGEKWVKTIDEENDNESTTTTTTVAASSESTTSVGMVVVDANGKVESTTSPPNNDDERNYDYEMMHRTLSNLPPEEQERMGGIPQLPEVSTASSKITPEQRQLFEKRMKEIWEQRQEELKEFQEDHLADLPQLLKDRIASLQEYLQDPIQQLQSLDIKTSTFDDEDTVDNILAVLQDLEYQLTDVDMARDFYTLGGWPLLSSLLADAVHENYNTNSTTTTTTNNKLSDDDWNKVNLIQAHAAWAMGTAVKNTGEFTPYATVEVQVIHTEKDGGVSTVKTTPLDLVLAQFVASTEAILMTTTTTSNKDAPVTAKVPKTPISITATRRKYDYYGSVVMKVHKTLYAIGAMLRGNRQAQTHFCADQGPALMATILGQLADLAEQQQQHTLPRDTLKVVQRLLSLAQDIVMDVTTHPTKEDPQVDEAIVKAFTSPEWCQSLLRFTTVPRLYETSLLTIRQLAPHCKWDNTKDVQQMVQRPPALVTEAWLPQHLDEDLREERMELLESTLKAIRQTTTKDQ